VGVIVKDKVVDWRGSTFKSAGNTQQRNSILLALKTAIN
jgi:hypothetical protein